MIAVSKSLRPALWFCACNLLAAALAAQCSNPTTLSTQPINAGSVTFSDANALSASMVINQNGVGSASVSMVAGNCIQLVNGFSATAGSAAIDRKSTRLN